MRSDSAASPPPLSPVSGEAQGSSLEDRLAAEWHAYFSDAAGHAPAHPAARDFMNADLRAALGRLVPADARVLEVGCGHGDLVGTLPNQVRLGIDNLPEKVAEARRAYGDSGARFEVGDALALPDASPRWDAVICDRLGHSVPDVKAMFESLRSQLADGGRIYLTTFNYLWEVPTRVAESLGFKRPAPTSNWLSESDFHNLFDITGLEVVKYEDRLMLPIDVPGVAPILNRYLVRLPPVHRLSLYRIYVLRAAIRLTVPRKVSVSVIVPARNEAGNIQSAIDRTPVMGSGTEVIFIEGHSTDDTWAAIGRAIAAYKGPLKLSAFQQTGKGKGDAVRLGFGKATGDLLMILDADLTVPPQDLPGFYDIMARGQSDYVQGTRLVYPMEAGAMRFFNKMGNIAFSQLFTYLLQQPIKDTLCGTKVLWRKDYERIAAGRSYFGDFDPFGDFDLIFGAARLNLKITEIPVRYRDRVYGQTNISRWKHGVLLARMSLIAARKLKFI